MEDKYIKVLNKRLLKAVKMSNPTDVRDFISYGAYVNTQDKYGRTPLIIALYGDCSKETSEIITNLIKSGCNINKADNMGVRPIHIATKREYSELIEIFIKIGVDVNVFDKKGNLPLVIASEQADYETVNILTEAGASLNATNEYGETSLMYAVRNNDFKLTKSLIAWDIDVNKANIKKQAPLHIAAINENIDIMNILIRSGANLYAKDQDNKTPLNFLKKKIFSKYYKYKNEVQDLYAQVQAEKNKRYPIQEKYQDLDCER